MSNEFQQNLYNDKNDAIYGRGEGLAPTTVVDPLCKKLDQFRNPQEYIIQPLSSEQNLTDSINQLPIDNQDFNDFELGKEDSNSFINHHQPIDMKHLFTEDLSVIGRVPLLFYVPDTKESQRIRQLIETHGGICIFIVECCSFQIWPDLPDTDSNEQALLEFEFSKGLVFSSKWIEDSFQAKMLLKPQNYVKKIIRKNMNNKSISFSRTKFSLREIIKIFDVVSKNPQRRTKNPTYWGALIDKGIFPGRSVHSINAQWQRFSLYESKDEAIRQSLKLRSPYCISFKDIPDHEEAITNIRAEIKTSRKGFKTNMKQLTDDLLKGEYDKSLWTKIHKGGQRGVVMQKHNYAQKKEEIEQHMPVQQELKDDDQIQKQYKKRLRKQEEKNMSVEQRLQFKISHNESQQKDWRNQLNLQRKRAQSDIPKINEDRQSFEEPTEETDLEVQIRQMYNRNQAKLGLPQALSNQQENESVVVLGSMDDLGFKDDEDSTIFGIGNAMKREFGVKNNNNNSFIKDEEYFNMECDVDDAKSVLSITSNKAKRRQSTFRDSNVQQQSSQRNNLSQRFGDIDLNTQMQAQRSKDKKNEQNDENNPGIYTTAYKTRILELSRNIVISRENKDNNDFNVIRTIQIDKAKIGQNGTPQHERDSQETNHDQNFPEMARLVHLHRRYCSKSDEKGKSLEDLQRDLFCVGNDLRKLEVYLQGGRVAYWTEMEDYVLQDYYQSQMQINQGVLGAYDKLVKLKGPEEVLNRKYFLKI